MKINRGLERKMLPGPFQEAFKSELFGQTLAHQPSQQSERLLAVVQRIITSPDATVTNMAASDRDGD